MVEGNQMTDEREFDDFDQLAIVTNAAGDCTETKPMTDERESIEPSKEAIDAAYNKFCDEDRATFKGSVIIALKHAYAIDFAALQAERDQLRFALQESQEEVKELRRYMERREGTVPDLSPGDVIASYSDGTIVLDDGITTWNPERALEHAQSKDGVAWIHQGTERTNAQQQTVIQELAAALSAQIPRYNNPAEQCWCANHLLLEDGKHSSQCNKARAALQSAAPWLPKEGDDK